MFHEFMDTWEGQGGGSGSAVHSLHSVHRLLSGHPSLRMLCAAENDWGDLDDSRTPVRWRLNGHELTDVHIHVTSYHEEAGHTEYVLETGGAMPSGFFSNRSVSYVSHRRYSAFRTLHKDISAQLGLPPFPVPRRIMHTEAVKIDRMLDFAQYLRRVARAAAASTVPDSLCTFLGIVGTAADGNAISSPYTCARLAPVVASSASSEATASMEHSTVRLQAMARGRAGRKAAQQQQEVRQRAAERAAAVRVQAAARGGYARRRLLGGQATDDFCSMGDTRRAAHARGEKLQELGDKASALEGDAANFAALANA